MTQAVLMPLALTAFLVLARRGAHRYGRNLTASLSTGAMLLAAFTVAVLRELSPAPCVLLAAVAVAAIGDLETGYIFDEVTAFAGVAVVVAAATHHTLGSAIVGAAVGFGLLATLHVVTRGRGIGMGDVKLAGLIGAGIGWAPALEAIGAAFVAGGIAAVALLIARHASRSDRVPFAPYLAVGTGAVLLGFV